MKKIFSHPMFYCIFALLGLAGMLLQNWYFRTGLDEAGLMMSWHPANIITLILLIVTVVLTLVSAPYIHSPKIPRAIRAFGAALGVIFTVIAAWRLYTKGDYLIFAMCVLSGVGSMYILWVRITGRRIHYSVYGAFALSFMFYLISRYRIYSAEPETLRYVFKILALVCMMLVFYQKAALIAHIGNFRSYHFWRSLTLFLCFTAIPSSKNPMLYLFGALWLLVDPSAPPSKKPKTNSEGEQT